MYDPALDESVQTLSAGFAFGRLLRPQDCVRINSIMRETIGNR